MVYQCIARFEVFAKTRTYEVALSMVQSGRGVAVVPALAARLGGKNIDFDVNLYRTNLPERKIISLNSFAVCEE